LVKAGAQQVKGNAKLQGLSHRPRVLTPGEQGRRRDVPSLRGVATANYVVVRECPDGSTVRVLVTVIGGREEESESGVPRLDSDFLTVRIRAFDCASTSLNDRGPGPAEFAFSPSLQDGSVTGTIATRDGRSVMVRAGWEGTCEMQKTSNTTTFPASWVIFKGKQRNAVVTGTVVVDGATLVDGSTTRAELETLEDKNINGWKSSRSTVGGSFARVPVGRG
jgi:hypothetical protein